MMPAKVIRTSSVGKCKECKAEALGTPSCSFEICPGNDKVAKDRGQDSMRRTSAYSYFSDMELAEHLETDDCVVNLLDELRMRGLIYSDCSECRQYRVRNGHDFKCLFCRETESSL